MKRLRYFITLLFTLTDKELRVRYKHTVFGFLWMVINPVLQMIVIGFIFQFIFKQQIQNQYYYLFTGLLAWGFFNISLSKTTQCIVNERSLVKKAAFPREVIPMSIILADFFNFLLALFILGIIATIGGFEVVERLPSLFFALMLLLVFTTGLSLLTSALHVKYRDVAFFVQALLTVWFYATPIVYTLSVIPERLLFLWNLNPMTSIVLLLQHSFLNLSFPNSQILQINIALILLIATLGVLVFRRESKNFDDWI
ncbi:MAG: ABC transporter permease [Microgenomates group bacterium]